MKKKLSTSVQVSKGVNVSTVAWWYQKGLFRNEDEAMGAFKLAYQQGMDGLGPSVEAWIGADWREGQLPPVNKAQVRKDMARNVSPYDSPSARKSVIKRK